VSDINFKVRTPPTLPHVVAGLADHREVSAKTKIKKKGLKT